MHRYRRLTYVYIANTEKTVFQIKWLLVPRDPASFLRDTHHVINPPTPADARGSALGNNTFDPGFGLVPLLYSIG